MTSLDKIHECKVQSSEVSHPWRQVQRKDSQTMEGLCGTRHKTRGTQTISKATCIHLVGHPGIILLLFFVSKVQSDTHAFTAFSTIFLFE